METSVVETIKSRLGSNIPDEDLSKILGFVEKYASEGKSVPEIISLVSKKMGCKEDPDSANAILKMNKDALVREASSLKKEITECEKRGDSRGKIANLKKERTTVLRKLKALQS